MSLLTLVRHAQASFFADEYDQLSDLGQTQAGLLGEHWAGLGLSWDEVYTGPRLRQRHTAELVGDRYRAAGLPWPEPVVMPELDEFDLAGVLYRLAPELVQRDSAFGGLMNQYRRSKGDGDHDRAFQRMFEVLMLSWQSGSPTVEGLEPWPAFHDRITRGLGRIVERPGMGRRVAVFTSGGVIGTVVQQVLSAPDRMALEVSWRVRNGSVSELVFTRDRLALDSFNSVAHLRDVGLWTYR